MSKRKVTKISNVSRNDVSGEISFVVGAVISGRPYYFYYRTDHNGEGLEIYMSFDKRYHVVWDTICFQIPGRTVHAITKWLYDHYEEFSYTYPLLSGIF